MKLKLIDRWDDIDGSQYLTVKINEKACVDIKRLNDEERFIYVMQCHDGEEVYDYDTTEGYRDLTDTEYGEVLRFAEEQFQIEEELNEKFKKGE